MNLHDDSDSTTNDMFTSLPLTKQQVTSYCQRRWGVTPAFNQLSTFYGDNSMLYCCFCYGCWLNLFFLLHNIFKIRIFINKIYFFYSLSK